MPFDDCHGCSYATITLREYVDTRLREMENATSLAASDMNRRLDGMNEFRDALKDQASKFITRDVFDAAMARHEADLRLLREARATLEGKASLGSMLLSLGVGVAGLILAAVSLILRSAK